LARRIQFDGKGNPVAFTVLNPNEVVMIRIFEGPKSKEVRVSNCNNFCRELSFNTGNEYYRDEAIFLLGSIGCDKWANDLRCRR